MALRKLTVRLLGSLAVVFLKYCTGVPSQRMRGAGCCTRGICFEQGKTDFSNELEKANSERARGTRRSKITQHTRLEQHTSHILFESSFAKAVIISNKSNSLRVVVYDVVVSSISSWILQIMCYEPISDLGNFYGDSKFEYNIHGEYNIQVFVGKRMLYPLE
jgi:hypothetical protein